MGLNATDSEAPPWQRGSPLPFSFFFFYFWGSSQAVADRLAGALTSQVFKETKTTGRAAGEEEWPAKWERRHIERDSVVEGEKKKNILNRWRSTTFWPSGSAGDNSPSSVFLELYNTPNYSVRKIKESQRAVEWKKKRAKLPRWIGRKVCCSSCLDCRFIYTLKAVTLLYYHQSISC